MTRDDDDTRDMRDRTTLTPEELAELPLEPTAYETATRASDAPRPGDDGPTTPGIPPAALRRRDVSLRRQMNRAEMTVLEVLSALGIDEQPSPEGMLRAQTVVVHSMRRALLQGRMEIGKQLADEKSESASAAARALEAEAAAMTHQRMRRAAETRVTEFRALLMRVRSGEVKPEEIEC
jgi:hypothetical protein